MIKPLYKSFVPYVILFVAIMILVYIFDSYAEKLTREPEVIYLDAIQTDSSDVTFSWHLENEIAIRDKAYRTGDSLYLQAMGQLRREQYEQANESSLRLISQAPFDPDTWNLRGIIALRMMKHEEAEEHFLKALELEPGYNEARINLASLYMNMHRYMEAGQLYDQARTLDPNNPEIFFNLGLLYTHMDLHEEAARAFQSAAGLASGEMKSRMLSQLGTTQLHMHDTLAARESLNEAVLLSPRNEVARLQLASTFQDPLVREQELLKIYRLHPSSFDANYLLGLLYSQEGQSTKSEYHLKKALEKKPYHEQTMSALGNLLIDQNRLDEADLVLAGFAVGDTLPQAYFFQAKIAVGKGSIDDAIRLYRLAIKKSMNDYPEAHLNMAILYKQQAESGRAIAAYKEAIRTRPNYSLAYYNLALLYTELDSMDRAIECYRESIRSDSTAEKSWYNLGRIFDEKEDPEAAISSYLQALKIRPDYMKAMLALGNAYLRNEDFDRATDTYLNLLEIYPHYSKAWFNLGLAYSRLENDAKAMEAYEKLIEVDPGEVRGRINLAILYGRNNKVELAIQVLEVARDLDTDNPDIRFNLALQYSKLEQFNEAANQLMQVIELDPEYRQAYRQLMQIYTETDDDLNFEIISFRYQKAFHITGDLYETGKRLHELDHFDLALEAYQLAREAGDDSAWLDYWTGKAEMDLGELKRAIPWFQKVLERDASHKFSLYRLGQIYEMLGDSRQAEAYYRDLLALDGEFNIVHKSPQQSSL